VLLAKDIYTEIVRLVSRGIEGGKGRTPPRHTARTTKTNIECKTNDDVPERGHHHNLRLKFCITEHGWIGAGGGLVEDFLWFARLLSHICFAAFVDAYVLSIPAIAYGLQAV